MCFCCRPLFWGNEGQRESKSQEGSKEKESPAESIAETTSSGRAASTSPTPIDESLKMVTKQLLNSPEATDMVATDIRTPPKIKTQIVTTEEFLPIGKGEAIPLDAENVHSYHVVSEAQHVKPVSSESTPTSGISTWILLNGGEQSTQASQKKQQTKPLTFVPTQTPPKKKVSKPNLDPSKLSTDTSKNISSVKTEAKQAAVITKVENPKKTQQSVNQEPLVKIPALMLQDAKFKNKTPVTVGKVPSTVSTKTKPENVSTVKKGEATITPVSVAKIEALAPQTIRRKVSATSSPVTSPAPTPSAKPIYQYELVPTTSVIVHTDIVDTETTEEVGTTEIPTTTTKRTRKPGTKKKKKNKNRRRRPANKTDGGVLEGKITDDGNSTRIIPGGSRPLSTRIYNYLSREIMPTVGVGIVGLMLTAGIAGLFLYPFGGGIAARRTYEKVSGPSTDNNMYYYNDYSPNAEVDNGQAEETVFGQVLAGMQQTENKYSKYSTRPSTAAASPSSSHYATQSKYRYDPSHEYGYHAAYQSNDKYSPSLSDVSTTVGRNPEGYSTLPDSASLASKYNPTYSVSGSQYSAPSGSSVITQYNDPKYTSSVNTKVGTDYTDSKYTSSDDTSIGIGSVHYDTKYSSPIDSTSGADTSETKYSTLTGLSVEPQSSKYTSITDDQSVKYPQSSKYTSLTDNTDDKYNPGPQYTSITDSHSSKYSSSDDQSSKYPTSAEYTAYSNPSDIGTQSGTYSSSNHKHTGYADIEYDDTKSLPSLTEEDKSDKSQPTFSALHASPDSYSNIDSMSMFSGSYNNEVRHRQGVLAIEHGPRNMKLDRQKRQADEKQNEVDGSLPEEQTTTERGESTTDTVTTDESKDSSSVSHESSVESTTWSMPKEPEFTTSPSPSQDQGFFSFLRRLAQMKLRIGLELLRSTTHAVARYLDTVQKRMETVVRDMDKKNSRQRRDIFKKLV